MYLSDRSYRPAPLETGLVYVKLTHLGHCQRPDGGCRFLGTKDSHLLVTKAVQ